MVDVCKPDVWTGVGVGRQPLPYRTMEELPVTRPNSRFPRLPIICGASFVASQMVSSILR